MTARLADVLGIVVGNLLFTSLVHCCIIEERECAYLVCKHLVDVSVHCDAVVSVDHKAIPITKILERVMNELNSITFCG